MVHGDQKGPAPRTEVAITQVVLLGELVEKHPIVSVDSIPKEGDQPFGNHEKLVLRILGLQVQTPGTGNASREPRPIADALRGKADPVLMVGMDAGWATLLLDGNQHTVLAVLVAHPPRGLIETATSRAGEGETVGMGVQIFERALRVAAAREDPAVALRTDSLGTREARDVGGAAGIAARDLQLHQPTTEVSEARVGKESMINMKDIAILSEKISLSEGPEIPDFTGRMEQLFIMDPDSAYWRAYHLALAAEDLIDDPCQTALLDTDFLRNPANREASEAWAH
jgi:hypothetical protein